MHYAKWKKSDAKGYIMYDSIYMNANVKKKRKKEKQKEKQNYRI